jgi:hypothetical protein
MTIPTTYTHADKLGPDGRAALSGARLVWDGLSPTMKRSLVDCWYGDGRCRWTAHVRTRAALWRRGLTEAQCHSRLSPLGILVREAGTRTRETSP